MTRIEAWAARLARLAFGALMATGLGLMLAASVSYLELGEAHPFFLEKLPLAHPTLWLAALYLHVPTALFALPACWALLSRPLRTRHPWLHRWLGRVTAGLLLTIVVPSGLYLGLFAQGGLFTTLGFWLTGLITLVATLGSIGSARRRDFRTHRRCSSHVAAQLGVAVWSRFLLLGAEALGLYGHGVSAAALWLPVVGSALIVERRFNAGRAQNPEGGMHAKMVAVSRVDVTG